MPKVPYSGNAISNNPLPFPNYLNSLSLLTDSSTTSVRKFFNANKSISEALLITLISVIQEGIAYQFANHSNINVDNNSKSYTNNTNFYCCKGVPIKPKPKPSNITTKKRSSSFSYSGNRSSRALDDNDVISKSSPECIIKDDESNSLPSTSLKKNRLSRSYSSSNLEYSKGNLHPLYTPIFDEKKSKNGKVMHGSHLKYSINEDIPESMSTNSSIELTDSDQIKTLSTLSSSSSSTLHPQDSITPPYSKPYKNENSKISLFILLKNLMNMLDIFRSLNQSQKSAKPVHSLESMDDKERWEEFGRVYNETMYNLKTEEYYKSRSLIFKYSTGFNTVQSSYFDIDDTNEEGDSTALHNSMSILDEKIRKNSENKKTDILSRIKRDTLTCAEIIECGEYMRRVGIYQIFIQCPINHFLRVIASKLFSCGEKKYSPILRFLFVTCVISPIQISVNILCLALSNKKTPSEIKKCFTDNFTHILKLSLVYVPFSTQYFARTFLPRHLWVPFFNISSFVLGTYIKLIMKKKDDRKLIHL